MKNKDREFEDFKKNLEQKLASFRLDGYARIAIGESYTKILEEENVRGEDYALPERKRRLVTYAKNKMLDELRSQRKLDHYQANPGTFEVKMAERVSPKEEDDYQILFHAIEKLSLKQKEAMKLRLEKNSVQDTAAKMEISTNSVKTHLKEGMKRLREILKKK